MRRNLQRLMVVMAAMMICLGASAIDKVVKKVTLTGEVTSVADLQAAEKFLLQDAETGLMFVALDGVGNYWDFNVATPATMIGNDGKHAGYFKLDKLSDQDHFRIEMYNINGSRRGYWGGDAYVNAQPGGNVIFGLDGQGPKYGQDGQDLALWDIEFDAEKGFAFKCVGRAIYIGSDGAENARPSDAPVYWKAYTGYESGFVAAEVEAAAKSVEGALKASDAKAAFADAKAAYEADKDVDAYAVAINAAIDVINACEQVNKVYAGYKLSTLGAAAVKAVMDKYNAGEYKDVAALGAAYVEAVKAQNCDGADMTGAIINPSFELGNTTGWTYEASNDHGAKLNSNGTYTMSKCDGAYLFNIWSSGNAISQTIEGLPNGTYKLSAVIATDEGHQVQLNGNDQKAQIDGAAKENGVDGEVEFEVTDGKATIGAEGVDKYWYKVDNFQLTLVKAANAVVPEKDAWYTGADFFRFRADKNAAADSPYAAYKDKVEPVWGAAPLEESNGCIVCKVPANVNPQSQIWIRGTEAGKTIANGSKDGFRVTFRVKADGEYTLESQAHNNWGYKTGGNPFGPLNVTTEWQTVSFVCTGEKAKNDFTDLCFNLSGDAERTIYFDDVQIVRGSEWYLNNEFHAKDYQDPSATYSDGNDPHPAARFVSDAEGGYVEVISNANAGQTYNSQLWIAIPEKYVGTSTKMTMEVQASKAIKCPESFQATATGNGWGCNPGPGNGVEFTVGEWTTVERVLKTNGVKSTGTWKNLQADQYCLDLSEASGDKEAITYKFRNVKFEDAAEPWTETMTYNVKVTPFTQDPADETKWVAGADESHAPEYNFGTGGEEGGYFEVQVNGKKANPWDTQFFFQIADVAPSKELKVNETVNLKFKVKALATETLVAGTELSLDGGFHVSNDGAGWVAGAPAAAIKVGEWSPVELKLDIAKYDKGIPTNYSINLTMDANEITYLIDEVEATWTEAPVLDWIDLIANGDCETAAEHAFAAAKETPVDGSNTHKARIVDGVGKDGGKGIEVVAGAKESQPWDNQFWIYEPYELPSGTKYTVEFDYRAENAAKTTTQTHLAPGAYQYWRGINDVNFTTEWQHFKYEGSVTYGDNDEKKSLLSIAFNLNEIAEGNTYYIDNIVFKVPAGTIDGIDPVYIDDYQEVTYIDPSTLDWSDNILKNGDLSGDDMSEFVLKNNDVEDPETLPAEKTEFGGAFEIDVETAARPTNEDGSVGGNDYDAQFFVRLPYVLPKGKKFNLEFDLYAEEINTLAIAAHAEPGQWKANISSVKTDPSVDAVHYQAYLAAPEDMRTIAINLAVATDATYAFSNFKVQVVKDDMAEIEAATTEADAASLWNETLALNEACYAGRVVDTEGYTEESVKALTDAVAAGKAELKNEAPTAESLAAATKAITDAIIGLTTGAAEELLPKPELGADFIEIAQDQGKSLDDFTRTDLVEGEDYNTYTAHGDLNIALKMMPVDVEGCDYVVVYFATPAPEGWKLAFWNNQDLVDVPAGATEFKYVFAEDPKCDVKDGVLPQICMMTFFGAPNPLEAKIYGIYKHKVPAELAYTDLTPEMFFQWSATDETAEAISTSPCDYNIATSTGQPYGLSTVNEDRFADLSAYSTIELTATEGEPRLLFNRLVAEGTVYAEVPRDKDKYETVVENEDGSKTYIVDIAAIVAEYGFAHLHAIKGANWQNTTVNSIKLGYVGEQPALPVPTNINGVEDGESVKDGKYFINGQIVIVKNGVKYNAAGVAIK